MRIGILTSSRADFGIYLPLLKKLKNDDFFNLKIIVFGTHLSSFYGKSINNIIENGYNIDYTIDSMLLNDSPDAISSAVGLSIIKFGEFWKNKSKEFDLIFCLGDRYEMFAAVTAGIPFQVSFAHLHGGEKTLGAIDNVFRDCITLSSKYHFVATEANKNRVELLTGSKENIYNTGALSLDSITEIELFTVQEFNEKWNIDLSKKTILTTFHPETIALNKNKYYIDELITVIDKLTAFQILITMPNADTAGNLIRQVLIDNYANSNRVFLIENLGTKGYFTALKNVSFLLGNTSSGIIEAASFGKYVINLGDRQKGRECGNNVIHSIINSDKILEIVHKIETLDTLNDENIYFNGGASDKIIAILKR